MTLPRQPKRGGNKKPVKLGLFIRDYLLSNGDGTGHDIYLAYKAAVQATPTSAHAKRIRSMLSRRAVKAARKIARSKGIKLGRGEKPPVNMELLEADIADYLKEHPERTKRKCINYNGFMHYLYLARRLGLVEYLQSGNEPITLLPHLKGSPDAEATGIKEAFVLRLTSSGPASDAWGDLWQAAYPENSPR